MTDLLHRHCQDYPAGTAPLSTEQQLAFSSHVPDWTNTDGTRIRREYRFKTYLQGIAWVQEVGRIADNENHHPEIRILYKKVILELWTHTVKGLSENDYILAAKFDASFLSAAAP